MSAMRSPLGGFGWGVLAEVDDRPVFARCFPRSRNALVKFCESAGRSKVVHRCAPMMGAPDCPQCGVRTSRVLVGANQ